MESPSLDAVADKIQKLLDEQLTPEELALRKCAFLLLAAKCDLDLGPKAFAFSAACFYDIAAAHTPCLELRVRTRRKRTHLKAVK